MNIKWLDWKSVFVEKIRTKHGVKMAEVEEVLLRLMHVRKAGRGHVRGEDLYAGFGRTVAGRYLIVLFVHKKPDIAMPISARDMTPTERRYYEDNN